MSELVSLPRTDHQLSRRTLLRGGVAAAALAALPSCDSAGSPHCVGSPESTGSADSTGSPSRVGANVRVSHDRYGVHVEPSVAANPRHPPQLLAACQPSPTPDPPCIATYLPFDGTPTCHHSGPP